MKRATSSPSSPPFHTALSPSPRPDLIRGSSSTASTTSGPCTRSSLPGPYLPTNRGVHALGPSARSG